MYWKDITKCANVCLADAVGGIVAMTVDSVAECNAAAAAFGCVKAIKSSHLIHNAVNATVQSAVALYCAVSLQSAVHKNG